MARHAQRGLLGELARNPLIIGTASGLAANLLGLSLPAWIEPTVSRIGAASLALGLMAAGAGMQFGSLHRAKALAVAVLGIRHFLLPLIAMGFARVFHLDPAQTLVLLAFSALPTAPSCYVLAARMGYDGGYVAGLVTLSTLLGMLSLPFALGVLRSVRISGRRQHAGRHAHDARAAQDAIRWVRPSSAQATCSRTSAPGCAARAVSASINACSGSARTALPSATAMLRSQRS